MAAAGALTLATATLGAGTAAADDTPGITVTTSMPTQLTPGAAPVPFTITASSTYDGPTPTSRYEFVFTGDLGLQADQLIVEYQEPEGTGYNPISPIALSGSTDAAGITGQNRLGYWVPNNAIDDPYLYIPANGNLVSNFKVSVKAGAPSGTLSTAAKLVLTPTSGADRLYGTALATTRIGDAPLTPPSANLQVNVEAPLTTKPGTDLTIKVTVRNDGPDAAGPTQTLVLLPAGYTLKNDGGGSVNNGIFGPVDTFTTPDLAPNGSITYTVTLGTDPDLFLVGFYGAYSVPTANDPNLFNNIGLGLTASF